MQCDYLIVGAGFFGSVIAERIANSSNNKVIVIDKRSHIGGNCYSILDEETGIEIHKYGTHIFHTSSKKVWDYITQFTEFNGYYHQVLTTYKGKVYQMPINLETINDFYGFDLKPYEAREFLETEIAKEGNLEPVNLEKKAISRFGKPLYEAFIRGYTVKQWDKNPKELPPSIINRLPLRYNYNENYFDNARWQGLPLQGYTKVFKNILKSPNIHVELNCDYFEHKKEIKVKKKTIFTGPIDRYFDYAYGKLSWRTSIFKKEIVDIEDYQGTAVMNYADLDVPYIRIHEPKHLHPERNYPISKTVIFYETSKSDSNNPYYPINTKKDQMLLKKYQKKAKMEIGVIFGGRLGDYAYYDMDKTINSALETYEKKIKIECLNNKRN
jgi:UDP-galactopyranose mutase